MTIRTYSRRKGLPGPKEQRHGRKRISADIPTWLHKLVSEASERSNITITMYLIRSLKDRLKKEGIDDI